MALDNNSQVDWQLFSCHVCILYEMRNTMNNRSCLWTAARRSCVGPIDELEEEEEFLHLAPNYACRTLKLTIRRDVTFIVKSNEEEDGNLGPKYADVGSGTTTIA
ncbi:unnamed protein product [Dovyalis caffra]|uniref:Uncharacterized protein n=1 Tax=Dovyalis caffra TaxID=77055 RepID=A0AAV1RYG4_9ROSI|nr:unnamed protein product [Dovyalis caffra]